VEGQGRAGTQYQQRSGFRQTVAPSLGPSLSHASRGVFSQPVGRRLTGSGLALLLERTCFRPPVIKPQVGNIASCAFHAREAHQALVHRREQTACKTHDSRIISGLPVIRPQSLASVNGASKFPGLMARSSPHLSSSDMSGSETLWRFSFSM